jgi:Putative abortive phage resistance protein AbiGi, antitoxin
MAISTNSIIHYTDSIEKLKSILKEGFKTKYCVEKIMTRGDKLIPGAFPMVCFCDIPLSDAKKHLDSYGYYGLGLKKSWASKKGLNPVFYIDKESSISFIVNQQGKRISTQLKTIEVEWKRGFAHICSFLKNYEGPLIRNSESIDDYRFYDEREWRFVPSTDLLAGRPNVIVVDKYLEAKNTFNEKVADIKLEFEFSDITYIIVKREEDVVEITKSLREVYAGICTATALEVLLTRVITVDQIINDF